MIDVSWFISLLTDPEFLRPSEYISISILNIPPSCAWLTFYLRVGNLHPLIWLKFTTLHNIHFSKKVIEDQVYLLLDSSKTVFKMAS